MECTCKHDNEVDECLGFLPGLANACCGHGEIKCAYVQFLDGSIVSGKDAVKIQSILKGNVNESVCHEFVHYQINDFEISKRRLCKYLFLEILK